MDWIKIVVLCLCVLTVVSGQQTNAPNTTEETSLLKRYQLECIEETRVDADLVMSLKAGSGWQTKLNPLKQWSLCVLKKIGLMSNEGVYKLDVAWSKVSQDADQTEVERLIDLCLTPKHLLPEEIAWLYIKCLHVNDPQRKLGFLSVV